MFVDSYDIITPKVDAEFYSCPGNMSEIGRKMIDESSKNPHTRKSIRTSPLSRITPAVLRHCQLTDNLDAIPSHKEWEVEFRKNQLFNIFEDYINKGSLATATKKSIIVPCENSPVVLWPEIEDGFRHKVGEYLSHLAGIDYCPILPPDLSEGRISTEKLIGNFVVASRIMKLHSYGPMYSKFDFQAA